jgi:hypothetical protein
MTRAGAATLDQAVGATSLHDGLGCTFCGELNWSALWMGHGAEVRVCCTCAVTTLAALLADAVTRPVPAQRFQCYANAWADAERVYWRAVAIQACK